MELPVRFVYTENGKEKSSIDENKRMNEIDQLNKDLHKWYIDGWRREEAKKMTISLRREILIWQIIQNLKVKLLG